MVGLHVLIKHVSDDKFPSGYKTKGPCCGDSKTMHCFTAKKFPNATAENSQPICKSAVWGLASAFQL